MRTPCLAIALQRRQHQRRIITTPIEEVVLGQTTKLRGILRSVPVAVGNEARDARIIDSVDGLGEQIRELQDDVREMRGFQRGHRHPHPRHVSAFLTVAQRP